MPGVGVGQQHGVGEMLAQHVGIADWNHIVEDAVNHQARLRDFAELGEALATVLFPGAKGRDLSDCDILAGQRLAILLSLGEPSCEGFSCRLTRLAWSEKEFHQFLQPRHIRIFRNHPEFRFVHVHNVLASLRSSGDEQYSVDKRGTFQRYLLRHHSTEGVPEDVQAFQAECIHECEGVCCHPRHVFGNLAGRAAQTRTFKENYLASQSERIGYGRVPIVQGPGEVLKTQQRQPLSFPKAAIGIFFELRLDELCRCGRVACISHGHSFLPLWWTSRLTLYSSASNAISCNSSKELGQTFGVAIMTTRDRSNDAVEKNAGDPRCGIDMELFRKNWRKYSGQRQSKSFCNTRLVALAADDAGPEDRQRFEANELHVPLDLALGLRIKEWGIGVGTNRRDKGERFCS